MSRTAVGEGSEVVSLSLPKEIARLLREHERKSALVADLLVKNIDVIGGIDYSQVEAFQKRILCDKVKAHLRLAIAEAVDEIQGQSYDEMMEKVALWKKERKQ